MGLDTTMNSSYSKSRPEANNNRMATSPAIETVATKTSPRCVVRAGTLSGMSIAAETSSDIT